MVRHAAQTTASGSVALAGPFDAGTLLAPPGSRCYGRHAEAGAAEGIAREGHARAVRGGRPARSAATRPSTTRRRSTTRASTRSASCARRRSRTTSPRGCSTSASPAATGSRRPPATSCRWASCSTRRPRDSPVRIVVAVPGDSPADQVEDLPQGVRSRASTPSSPGASSRRRASRPTSASPTAPPRPRCPTSSTASSTSPRPAARCGPPASRSSTPSSPRYTELIANPASLRRPGEGHAMHQIHTLLEGVLEARGKVLVKLNVPATDLDAVIDLLPSMKSPTVNELYGEAGLRGRDGRAEGDDQHADPGAQGRRRHRHHRAPALQDRPLTVTDRVTSRRRSTTPTGYGTVRDRRRRSSTFFHCTAIADGTRTIEVGAAVDLRGRAGSRRGRWEAAGLQAGASHSGTGPSGRAGLVALQLDERGLQLGERVDERAAVLAEAVADGVERRRPWRRWPAGPRRSSAAPATGGSPPARRSPGDVVGDDLGGRRRQPAGAAPRPSRRSSPRPAPAPRGSGPSRLGPPTRPDTPSSLGVGLGLAIAVDGNFAARGPQAHGRTLRVVGPRVRPGSVVGRARGGCRCSGRWLVPYGVQLKESGARAPTRPQVVRCARVDVHTAGRTRRLGAGVGFPGVRFVRFRHATVAAQPQRQGEDQRIDQE